MLTLWDSRADPPLGAGLVYRWSGYAETPAVRSLLRYVDANSERLRRKYIAWIHDLGESRIDGKRLIDHFALSDGLSYWWMTLLVEQSPWKSRGIVDAIRVLALEEIVVGQKCRALRLVSANRKLDRVLSGFAATLEIRYEYERPPSSRRAAPSLRAAFRALPTPVKALISLVRYVHPRWVFRSAKKSRWFPGDRALFLCSYFDNVDPAAASQGRFESNYWMGLDTVLQRLERRGNWLQIFVPCDATPTPASALRTVERFNADRTDRGFHVFVESFLSWRVLLRVLARWVALNRRARKLGNVEHAFRPLGSKISLWPLLREDWQDAIRGPTAISNLLWIDLFDRAVRSLPRQSTGVYLCENQSWERALIHAWRKHGHGRLIAVAHSTVRLWDLRYFNDSRTVMSTAPHPMPLPDLVALNGQSAVDAYRGVGYPEEGIVECEALRYGYLSDLRSEDPLRTVSEHATRVLILGGHIPVMTRRMLQLLDAAASSMSDVMMYSFKPHPNFSVKPEEYPRLRLTIVTDQLMTLLGLFDVAFASNMTSAAVDAHLAGMPVVVMLDDDDLNYSPLRGQDGVPFVSTPDELSAALKAAGSTLTEERPRSDFFFLDPSLPRWSKLLAT